VSAGGHRYERDETAAQRLDRNYSELLQELRVAQMGVQILFAFLLSIAFQQRFSHITSFERVVYYCTLVATTISAAFFIAPVAAHRVLFGRRLKDELVRDTGRMLVIGIAFMGLAMLGALLLIIDVVSGPVAAGITTGVVGVLFTVLWLWLPVRQRSRWLVRPEEE
jgi:hypothetical protein